MGKTQDQKKLKIAFLSSCVRGGGAGWSLYYLLKYIDRNRFEPLVVVPQRGIFDEKFKSLDLRVVEQKWLPHRTLQQVFPTHNALTRIASGGINICKKFVFTKELIGLIKREKVDLVYANNMLVKPLGGLAATFSNVPCILHARNIHDSIFEMAVYGSVAKLKAVRRIIANSKATAAPYQQVAKNKVKVIYNGIDLEEYDTSLFMRGTFRRENQLQDKTIVGFTGNLIPRKGLSQLIRAAALLLPSRPELVFVILGRVPVGMKVDHLAQYKKLAESLGIADRVRFLGFFPDVRRAVLDFDILALPSLQEPFGRSIIEAMALGSAVVASRVGGIPEIIDDQVDGLLCEPAEVDQLAKAIAQLADSREKRQQVAEAARQKVEKQFDVAMLTKDIEQEILEAIHSYHSVS